MTFILKLNSLLCLVEAITVVTTNSVKKLSQDGKNTHISIHTLSMYVLKLWTFCLLAGSLTLDKVLENSG